MALGEALTNLLAADIAQLSDIRLSANWMAAANYSNEDSELFNTVNALTEMCRILDIAIPVGKDSLSMQTVWEGESKEKRVVSPVSLIVSAFAPVTDVRRTWTPQLQLDQGDSFLVLIDLGKKANRLGGSILGECYQAHDTNVPDVDPGGDIIEKYTNYISKLRDSIDVLSYHDRSDGGLLATLCEMAFAGRCGLNVQIQTLGSDPLASLFAEELGCVLQVKASEIDQAVLVASDCGLEECIHLLGEPTVNEAIVVTHNNNELLNKTRSELEQTWSQVSTQIQQLRDNPKSAQEEFKLIADSSFRGLQVSVSFDINEDVAAPLILQGAKPRIAILREQGVNGHIEMAAAFDRAGFEAVDVHMTDLIDDRYHLNDFKALAACGGFSYGDVLGAGSGWANNIIYNNKLKEIFQVFFNRDDVLALGVCNGCQMMSQLKSIIPGAESWPRFLRNESEQFEARLVNVEVLPSNSMMLAGMQGSILPISVAHGEGRISSDQQQTQELLNTGLASLRYVDSQGQATQHYPLNPNGSSLGVTAVTNEDGRFTIMMPHPERLFRAQQHSWHPHNWDEDGPWMRMFRNARVAFN
jgi:phosphoribosylformylglycinamidine synthase